MSFLIGLMAGIFGGLVGLGGGVLMIPLMVSFMKLRQHKAHGTSLVTLVFTGIIGASVYALHGSVDIWAAVFLAATALWPARCGARYCCDLPEIKLRKAFGAFLIIISVFLLLKSYIPSISYLGTGVPRVLALLVTGVVTGFISGLMGVGAGAVMIGGMVLLAGFNQHTAQGTSLLAMIPAGALGAYTHWRLGNIDSSLLHGLIPGIILGTFTGGSAAHLISEFTLRAVFAIVLIWTGSRFIKNPAPACE
jgi:uncharacterized protein